MAGESENARDDCIGLAAASSACIPAVLLTSSSSAFLLLTSASHILTTAYNTARPNPKFSVEFTFITLTCTYPIRNRAVPRAPCSTCKHPHIPRSRLDKHFTVLQSPNHLQILPNRRKSASATTCDSTCSAPSTRQIVFRA